MESLHEGQKQLHTNAIPTVFFATTITINKNVSAKVIQVRLDVSIVDMLFWFTTHPNGFISTFSSNPN